jgi:hypothetical protein
MLRTREIEEIPPKFDEEGNPVIIEVGSKTGTASATTLEDHMRQLEKLTAKTRKLELKLKARRQKEALPQVKKKTPHLKRMSPKNEMKGRRNRDKPSYNSMSFNYNNMLSSNAYTSIPFGKVPYFDGTSYNQWKHCMKNYLYSISSRYGKFL